MKCELCNKEALKNKVICSEHCQEVRLKLFALGDKYTPTHGCDNCWGDLGGNCTEECNKEFKKLGELMGDLWSLVHLVTNKKKTI